MNIELPRVSATRWKASAETYTELEWAVVDESSGIRFHGKGQYAEQRAREDAEKNGGVLSTRYVRIKTEGWGPR